MYSLINIMFNNFSKFLFETNNNIISISNELCLHLKNLHDSYDKRILVLKEKKSKMNEKIVNYDNNKILKENKMNFLENINKDLTEIQKDFVETINLINGKFVEFSDLINNNFSNNTNKFNFRISPISSISIVF